MRISEKIKAINNKVEQTKLNTIQTDKLSKYEFLIGEVNLPEKDLLENTTTIKRFDYSLLGKELKAQTSAAEKQYQKLDKVFESDKKE